MPEQSFDIDFAGQYTISKHGTEHGLGEKFHDIRNMFLSIGENYHQEHWNSAQLEAGLHDAWDFLIQISKATPAISPEQDKLVVLILTIEALQVFSHRSESKEGQTQNITLSHRDQSRENLPFLALDLQNEWITKSQQYTSCERKSFAAFTAKLYAAGMFENELSIVVLWLLKMTLEEKIPLRHDTNQDDNITQCGDGSTPKSTVADLLPACFAWLANANFKLLTMAAENYNPCSSVSLTSKHEARTVTGSLAAEANVKSSGFSISRWVFWRFRLKELTFCADEEVSQLARESFNEMIHTGVVLGIDVHGEKTYLSKVHEAVSSEFKKRGMTECVDASDVSINMDWAD
ncbi:hypothetical protein N7478_010214 [Penicillium angulare]|uniref:uncharacterized protein n=1 Tax=Penicillium angulare TaxID=116970 RepID=UPI0025408B06|nr:uncharacterized protein N7478_010214 [Penicillium angulare]KAJ5267406.1 hypothetical protein N7478_010214 [Penicillium angulare]